MKTEDRATPLFTATAFAAISAALFFLSGCSADSSIAGASEEESTVSAEAVNQGTALARGQVSSETVVFGEVTDPRDGQKYRTVKIGNNTWFAQNLNFETANSERSSQLRCVWTALYPCRCGECLPRRLGSAHYDSIHGIVYEHGEFWRVQDKCVYAYCERV